MIVDIPNATDPANNCYVKCAFCGRFISGKDVGTEDAPVAFMTGGDHFRPPDTPEYAHAECINKWRGVKP